MRSRRPGLLTYDYCDDANGEHFLADYIAPNYQGDYHRMYFGEVLAAAGTPEHRR